MFCRSKDVFMYNIYNTVKNQLRPLEPLKTCEAKHHTLIKQHTDFINMPIHLSSDCNLGKERKLAETNCRRYSKFRCEINIPYM